MIKVWQLGLLLVVAMLVGAKAQKDGKQYWDKAKSLFSGNKTTPTGSGTPA